MGSDYSEPEAKEASSNERNSCSMLEKLLAMNATKTELRQYIQFSNYNPEHCVDTVHS